MKPSWFFNTQQQQQQQLQQLFDSSKKETEHCAGATIDINTKETKKRAPSSAT